MEENGWFVLCSLDNIHKHSVFILMKIEEACLTKHPMMSITIVSPKKLAPDFTDKKFYRNLLTNYIYAYFVYKVNLGSRQNWL